MLRHVSATRVAERDGGVGVLGLLAKDRRHWFADNVAPAEDHHFRALDRHAGADEQFVHAAGCARDKTATLAEHQFSSI